MENNTKNTNNSKIRLTGLWPEKDKDGRTYLSGSINGGAKLYIFPCKDWVKGSSKPKYEACLISTSKKEADEKDDSRDEKPKLRPRSTNSHLFDQ